MTDLVAASPHPAVAQTLFQSFSMIVLSEIGDKTFLVAAVLAMRRPSARRDVFAGAFGAMLAMSALSALLGHHLPRLLAASSSGAPNTTSRVPVTQALAGVLFLVFGTRMWAEARRMAGGSQTVLAEMKEAEEEVEADDEKKFATAAGATPARALDAMESGRLSPTVTTMTTTSPSRTPPARISRYLARAKDVFGSCLGPVFVQAFALTFLGEWGDRSQIATIVLGASHNVYAVIVGTVVGHAFCTALAVLGGRYLSMKISVRGVTLSAAVLFILFGVLYLYQALLSLTSKEIDLPTRITDSGEDFTL
jgi:putative Ca2+/H+ antiporter (TMEM165/GDT1 family)